MSFEIEKDIPLGITWAFKKEDCPYPFANMSVGDSFFVEADMASFNKKQAHVRNWTQRWRRFSGIRAFNVAIRTDSTGFRVWRTS